MRMLLALGAFIMAMPATAQTASDPDEEFGITEVGNRLPNGPRDQIVRSMADSVAGWNSGDLDRFLAVYSDDPATSFVGSTGVARGKAGIRAKYLVGYAGQFGAQRNAATMSTLSFTFEDFRMIGAEHALLIARWKLVKPDGTEQSGMTSLLFRSELLGWKIIADHSS